MTVWPWSTLRGDPAARAVRDIPDQQPEQGEHDGDGDGPDGAHQRMKTVVPTFTWSNSHSASGTCIRMQPCDSL